MGNWNLVRILPVFAALLSAAEPNLSDQFYKAIRSDDQRAVGQLLKRGADVNTRDSRDVTPLMYAAAAGSPEMMRLLLAKGANVNAKNSFDATALMWCSTNLEKVRLLVDKGADVNARTKRGNTPLLIAAASDGNVEVIRLLLKKGASLKKAQEGARNTPLVAAAMANDTATVKLFLEQGADAKAGNGGGITALIPAAGYGNAELVKLLLDCGAGVNAQTAPNLPQPVKNGPIAIGNLTPLLLAVTSGSTETVRLLLDAGADVNAKDVRGMTPLMLAVATDHPNETIIRMLLEKTPATDVKSKANETALDWAAKFQHPWAVDAVRTASPGLELTKRQAPETPHANRDVRQAVEKSVVLLQKVNTSFLREGGCISCHAQNITSLTVAAARASGIRVDEAIASDVARGTRLQFSAFADMMLERIDPPAVEILNYAMFAIAADRTEPDRITDAIVHNIAAQQRADGSWTQFGIMRPPTMDGGFSVTAFGLRALREYGPPGRKAEMDERVAKAAKWLMKAEPTTTEDYVTQLLGAKWAGMDRATIEPLAKQVVALQREDGGWAQTSHLACDAYATGTALYALKEAGDLAVTDAAYRKGIAYLLSTQAEDGSWFVASRAPKFQPFFEGGFPYGHDQWISEWATGYATAALSYAVPESRAAK